MFDLILQNNASREFYLYQGLENASPTELYIEFDDVDIDAPDGEYTYALICNDNSGVTYTFRTPILDTIVAVDGITSTLKQMKAYTGLMRIGEVETENVYDDDHISFPYDGKKDNNSTLYYEG